jgi:hypothetical protein
LFQAIKYVPIYGRVVRELCLKKPGWKKRDPQTVQVLGHLADLILGNILTNNYIDPGSLIVDFHINNISNSNTQ